MCPQTGNRSDAEPSGWPAADAPDAPDAPDALEQAAAGDGNHALMNQAVRAQRRTHELRDESARLKAAARSSRPVRADADDDAHGLTAGRVPLLREDPDLGAALPADQWERFEKLLHAPLIVLRGKTWHPPGADHERMLGMLVLGGLLGRRVRLGDSMSIELLGRGDVVRPWQEPPDTAISARVDWQVLAPARLALLDERIARWIGLRHELTLAFANRLSRRAHSAAYMTAIAHVKRVEERLLAVLWHVASNWGHVTSSGVRIPFRLTHEVLGQLVGAQRPSVTIGLSRLRERGDVARTQDGRFLLPGRPPSWRP